MSGFQREETVSGEKRKMLLYISIYLYNIYIFMERERDGAIKKRAVKAVRLES